ncbi:hypothetical protein H0H92_004625 [Tricholoma furcatifolium]|nr:hypothetical protein H0H92_004625 [Tricholoma furcatifolium]
MEDSHDEANWTQHPPPGPPELLARRSSRPRRDSHSRKHRDSHIREPDRERERDPNPSRVSSKPKMRDNIERDLALARRKEEWIENENNLLLDAIYAAEPELLKFVHPPFRSPVLTPLQSPVHTPRELPLQVHAQPYPYSAHPHPNSRSQAHTPHSLHARPSPHLHPTPRLNNLDPHPQPQQHASAQALHQEEPPVPAPMASLSTRASPIPALRPPTRSPRSPPHLGPNVSNERGHVPAPGRTHVPMDVRDREGREQHQMQTTAQIQGHHETDLANDRPPIPREHSGGVSPRLRAGTELPLASTTAVPVSAAPVPAIRVDLLNRDRPEDGVPSTNGVSSIPGPAGDDMEVEPHEHPSERESAAVAAPSTSEPQSLPTPPG